MYYLPDQLQNFESIIDETQSQFEQFEKLKVEIQKMKRILFSFKLSNMLKNKILDISHVEVVVYRSVFDVEEMTNESITIENPEDYRFISIELFIPKFLLSIFVENNFRVCMSVYHGKSTVSKSFSLNESTAVRAIIPIKESVLNCDVELLVFGKIHGKIITLKIPTVKIDISYYLVSDYAKEKGKIHKQSKKLAKIFTLYNTNCDKHVMKEYYLKYQILNSLSQQCLLEKLLKTAIHIST
ncbi:hypothetical protein HHI36_020493 [Cryptolaemus montrouzieri]|uniref:Uncharacterized protein n=1 Tax=Cryptolaemus montrouzieri TaxID=559131 RepID=A0ABD2NAX2_9CUCU